MSEQDTENQETQTFTQADIDAAVNKANEAKDNHYSGIVKNRDDLLTEKKAAEADAKEAATKAKALEDQKIIDSGTTQELKDLHNSQMDALKKESGEKYGKLEQKLLKAATDSEVTKLTGLFAEQFKGVGESLMKSMYNVTLDDQNNEVHEFRHAGNLVASNFDDARKYINESSDFQSMLKGEFRSGSGATGSKNGSGGATKKFSDYSPAQLVELKRKDPIQYKKLKGNK